MDPAVLSQLESTEVKLGEKHKLLNDFLRQAKKNPAVAEQILGMKDASDFYMKKLRFDLILALQRVDLLIELFNSEEKALTARVSKKGRLTWIFTKEGSPFLDPHFLAKEFFPKLSYVCRLKFVNQLAKHVLDEKKCEKIFEAIQTTFGLKYAARLLPNCSPPFISKILATNRLKKVRAFLIPIIATKHPQVAFEYVKTAWESERKKSQYANLSSNFVHEYGDILRKLAVQDMKQFLDLYELHHEDLSGLHIGHFSRRVVKQHLDRVLKSPIIYSGLVSTEDILELEKGTQVKFLTPLLPKRFSDLKEDRYYSDEVRRINEYLDENLSTETFKELIEKGYPGQDVVKNHTDDITTAIAIRFGPEDRLHIAEHHLKDSSVKGNDCYTWISIKPISKSIPELKQLLFIESDAKERENLIVALLKTCKINNDKTSLLEVMKFLTQRYRNDQIEILLAIIQEIDQFPKLMSLGDEIWNVINDLLQVYFLHPGSDCLRNYSWRTNGMMHKLFANLATRDLPVESIIEKIYEMLSGYINFSPIEDYGIQIQKKYVEACAAYYSKKYGESKESDQMHHAFQVGELFKRYNELHRKKPISVEQFPALKKKFLEYAVYDEDKLPDYSRVQLLGIWDRDPVLKKEIGIIQKSMIKTMPNENTLEYFMLHDPSSIVVNMDKVEKCIFERGSGRQCEKFLDTLKHHSYKDIIKLLIEKSLARLESDDVSKAELQKIFYILACYQTSAWQVDFIKKYIPQEPKIDLQKENVQREVQRVEFGVRSLLYIDQPSVGLPIIKSFCIGDYLKYARDVFYSLCEHAKPSNSLELLSAMVDSPVSLKKHVIRLYVELATPGPGILTFLETLWKKEDNVSIREVILHHTLELLLHDSNATEVPKIGNFLFNTIIPSLNFKDKAALEKIVDNTGDILGIISGETQEKFLWSIFGKLFVNQDNLPPIERLSDTIKIKLIHALGTNHSLLSDQLLLQLAQKYFFPSTDLGIESEFVEYFMRILLLREETIEVILPELLNKLTHVLAEISAPNFPSAKKAKKDRIAETRERFCEFFQTLCVESFERRKNKHKHTPNETKYITLLEKFYTSELFRKNAVATFDECFWIQMAIIFHSKQANDIQIGEAIVESLNIYLSKYGSEILVIFMKNLREFMQEIGFEGSGNIKLVQGIIKFSPDATVPSISTPGKILALKLFPAECPHEFDHGVYDQISKMLFTPTSELEGIYINNWLNTHY